MKRVYLEKLKRLEEIMTCPVCRDIISNPPVYQCCNGHIMCSACSGNIVQCSMCRKPLETPRIRNLYADQVAEEFFSECMYKDYGCNAQMMVDRSHHQSACPYRELNYCELLGSTCSEFVSLSKFEKHIRKKHGHAFFGIYSEIRVIYQQITKQDFASTSQGYEELITWEPLFLNIGENDFAILANFKKPQDIFSWKCILCENPSKPRTDCSYQFHILLGSESSTTKLQWSEPVTLVSEFVEGTQVSTAEKKTKNFVCKEMIEKLCAVKDDLLELKIQFSVVDENQLTSPFNWSTTIEVGHSTLLTAANSTEYHTRVSSHVPNNLRQDSYSNQSINSITEKDNVLKRCVTNLSQGLKTFKLKMNRAWIQLARQIDANTVVNFLLLMFVIYSFYLTNSQKQEPESKIEQLQSMISTGLTNIREYFWLLGEQVSGCYDKVVRAIGGKQ